MNQTAKTPTRREKERAQRAAERVIDALVLLQELGFGNDAVSRCLELANEINHEVQS